MRDLEGRIILVTGAAGGIGKEICKRFAEEGSIVIATDLNALGLEDLKSRLNDLKGSLQTHVLNITDALAVESVVSKVLEENGKIDALINNAGWDHAAPVVDTDPNLWHKLININLIGPLNLQKTVLPSMIASSSGKIINIASDAGRV